MMRRHEAVQRERLTSGPGARVASMGHLGKMVRFEGGGGGFSHPWQVSFGGKSATFTSGSINNVLAAITPNGAKAGIPLEGDKTHAAPSLIWETTLLDLDGIGYLCAEATVDPKNNWSVTAVEMVQVADPDTDDGKPGKTRNASGGCLPVKGKKGEHKFRVPIAMLRQRAGGSIDLFQVTFFNLTHRASLSLDGKPLRHFVW